MAEHYGVNISTLIRWDNEGNKDSIRTPGNQGRFCIDEEDPKTKPVIAYARVSSHTLPDDLDRQIEFLHAKYPNPELFGEIGSGLNFKRRKFLKILERICASNISTLVVADADRAVRFGFPLIEWLCQQNGVKLLV